MLFFAVSLNNGDGASSTNSQGRDAKEIQKGSQHREPDIHTVEGSQAKERDNTKSD
jgi:hypothetical protein